MPALTPTQILDRVLAEIPNAEYPDLLYVINGAIEMVSSARRWRFYQERYQFDTTIAYSTGTVSLTQGDATVSGSGTTFTSGMVGRKFSISGYPGIYEIESYTSATEIELSRVWASESVSGSEYSIFQNAYSLPSNCRSVLDVLNLRTNCEVTLRTRKDTILDWASYIEPMLSQPTECIQFGNDANGNQLLIFNGVSSTADPIEICYYRWPTAMTSMNSSLDAPDYLQEYIYFCILERIARRFKPQDIAFHQYVRGEKLNSLAMAKSADASLVSPYMRNRPNMAFR